MRTVIDSVCLQVETEIEDKGGNGGAAASLRGGKVGAGAAAAAAAAGAAGAAGGASSSKFSKQNVFPDVSSMKTTIRNKETKMAVTHMAKSLASERLAGVFGGKGKAPSGGGGAAGAANIGSLERAEVTIVVDCSCC
jgi:hypothetical protein